MSIDLSPDEIERLLKGCHWRTLDTDAEHHDQCDRCKSRITQSKSGDELGHKYGCPNRPEYLPDSGAGGSSYRAAAYATDGGTHGGGA